MNATQLLSDLRPPLEESPADEATLERILLAAPEATTPSQRRRYARPLAVATATGVAAVGVVTLAPSGSNGPVGLAGAVAALREPDVVLHFKVTTTHAPSGAVESGETWQTPDGRRMRTLYGTGLEFAYDEHARVAETYAPESNEVIVDTDPTLFPDEDQPFGSVATGVTSSPTRVGDLPGLVTRALGGEDPNVRHVGRTTVRGIDVDHIRIRQELEVARTAGPGATPPTRSGTETVTVTRDVYVRHTDALPVRVVDTGLAAGTKDISDFTDVQKLTLDGTTEPELELADHPGAERRIEDAFEGTAP